MMLGGSFAVLLIVETLQFIIAPLFLCLPTIDPLPSHHRSRLLTTGPPPSRPTYHYSTAYSPSLVCLAIIAPLLLIVKAFLPSLLFCLLAISPLSAHHRHSLSHHRDSACSAPVLCQLIIETPHPSLLLSLPITETLSTHCELPSTHHHFTPYHHRSDVHSSLTLSISSSLLCPFIIGPLSPHHPHAFSTPELAVNSLQHAMGTPELPFHTPRSTIRTPDFTIYMANHLSMHCSDTSAHHPHTSTHHRPSIPHHRNPPSHHHLTAQSHIHAQSTAQILTTAL